MIRLSSLASVMVTPFAEGESDAARDRLRALYRELSAPLAQGLDRAARVGGP